jgi:phospholipid/cholesterol/gamma-HCH transport system permease protein
MEASAQPAAYRRGEPSPASTLLSRVARGFVGPIRSALEEAGQISSFGVSAFVEMRGVLRYTSETLRQVGILIAGSALVLLAMQFTFGLTCGNESVYVLRGYGASS